MKQRKQNLITIVMGILLGVLMVSPLNQGTAKTVLSETFDTADEWDLGGYEFIDWETSLVWDTDYIPKVENGVLQMPNTQTDWWYLSQAYHSSTVAYGTWSFDWYVNAGKDHQSYDTVAFIANNMAPTKRSGYINENMSGYALTLTSDDKKEPPLESHAVALVEFENGTQQWKFLKSYQLSSTLIGWHHIDITRNVTGQFNIYFDNRLVLQLTDNSTKTCENFAFYSWYGDSVFDNLTVSDTVDPISTITESNSVDPNSSIPDGTNYPPLFIIVVSIGVIIILRKNRRK